MTYLGASRAIWTHPERPRSASYPASVDPLSSPCRGLVEPLFRASATRTPRGLLGGVPPRTSKDLQNRLEGRSRTPQGPPRTLQASPSTHQAPPRTPQANPRTRDDLPRTLAGSPMTCRWTTPQSGPVNYPQRKNCGRSATLKALTHTTPTTKHTHTQRHDDIFVN